MKLQLEKTQLKSEPTPAEIKNYLDKNRSQIETIVNHINNQSQPIWELNLSKIYQDKDPFNYPLINYLSLVHLQRILLIQILYEDQNTGDTEQVNSL